jgi:hypothetical protein
MKTLAAALLCVAMIAGSAQAQHVVVVSDIGYGTVDVHGTSGGATIVNDDGDIEFINGQSVYIDMEWQNFRVVQSHGVFSGSGSLVIGEPGNSVTLSFVVADGFVWHDQFDLDLTITAVSSPSTVTSNGVTYDFGNLRGGGISLSLYKTGVNFAGVLNNPKAVVLNVPYVESD